MVARVHLEFFYITECPTWPTPRITPYLQSPHLPKPSGLRLSHHSHRKKLEKKGASKKILTRGEKTGVQVSASKDQATRHKSIFKVPPNENQSKKETSK